MTRDEQIKKNADAIEVLVDKIAKRADQAKNKTVQDSVCFKQIKSMAETIVIICNSLFG